MPCSTGTGWQELPKLKYLHAPAWGPWSGSLQEVTNSLLHSLCLCSQHKLRVKKTWQKKTHKNTRLHMHLHFDSTVILMSNWLLTHVMFCRECNASEHFQMPVMLVHLLCLIKFMDYDKSGLMHLPNKILIEVTFAARAILVAWATI